MRSAIIIGIGLALLGVFLLAGRYVGGSAPTGMSRAALYFVPVWLAAAGINMWVGVTKGYSVAEEAPIFAMIFAIPAVVAVFLWRRFSHG